MNSASAIGEAEVPGSVCINLSDVAPRTGEYERSVPTAFNSYIGPIVGDYLMRLEQRLKELGMPCSLLVVQSNGGLSTVGSMLGKPLVIVDLAQRAVYWVLNFMLNC